MKLGSKCGAEKPPETASLPLGHLAAALPFPSAAIVVLFDLVWSFAVAIPAAMASDPGCDQGADGDSS